MRRFVIWGLISGLSIAFVAVVAVVYARFSLGVAEIQPRKAIQSTASQPLTVNPDDWYQWRGPDSNGISQKATPPTKWSKTENVAWEAKLPGNGHSSPVVCGDAVYLTTADDATGEQSVVCLDLETGNIRWNHPVLKGVLPVKHERNSHASATPACDSEHVYTIFASDDAVQVLALDRLGKTVWKTNAGPFASFYGFGTSPTLFESLVIVHSESRGSKMARLVPTSFMAALDRRTGEVVWRIRRTEEHSYGSPVIAKVAGKTQLIVAGPGEIKSYDPLTSKEIWTCRIGPVRIANTPTFDDNNIYVSAVYSQQEIVCIKADGEGDVTDTHAVWRVKRGACDVPSPVVYNGFLYILQDKGVLSRLNTSDGKMDWQKRLGGDFSASPLICNGHLYAANHEGQTSVFSLEEKPELVETNSLEDTLYATPTPCGSSLLIRTTHSLWRIRNEPAAN